MLRLIIPLRLRIFDLTIFCIAAAISHAHAADADTAVGLTQLEPVPSVLFDADMVRFDVADQACFILIPAKPAAAVNGKPWVWYAPTLLAENEPDWISPGKRHAWFFKRLLAGGVFVAGVDVGESYGSPAGRTIYTQFHAHMVRRLAFSPKPGFLPISRGGMMAYNWAAEHPDCVSCIGAVYPLCNLRSFEGLARIAKPYDLTAADLLLRCGKHNPVDRLAPLAASDVRILHIHGDKDAIVPLETHSAELVRRFTALGGNAELIVVRGKGHEVALEYWQEHRLVDFLLKNVIAAAR